MFIVNPPPPMQSYFAFVCVFVCLSVCVSVNKNISKYIKPIKFMFGGNLPRDPGKKTFYFKKIAPG